MIQIIIGRMLILTNPHCCHCTLYVTSQFWSLNYDVYSFQLVVLRDPNEDQDDILRANRSRERQYIFDVAFGPNATQVGTWHYCYYLGSHEIIS